MGNFADVLINEGEKKKSVLVVGLDPDMCTYILETATKSKEQINEVRFRRH